MSIALVTMSHSPLLDYNDPAPEVKAEVDAAFATACDFVADFDPTLVVSFAPDHYNGFFYDLMPPFCIGYEALGVGDYGTAEGPLDVPTELAERMAEWVAERDLDVAISRRMEIDHGAVQPLEILFGGIDAVPTIPVFVNGVAKPFVKMARVRRLGEVIGSFLATLDDERVLVVGSGGLSHDPPVPQWATATEPQRALLLNGRHPTAAARDARQQRVIDAGRAFAADSTATSMRDLNPEWDTALMDVLASGDLSPIDAMDPAQMAVDAGNSAHEVRTWVAAFAALGAAGPYTVRSRYYRPIREYIAGFGVMTAR
ncbi:3-carboxyethylcatechol 2,3-dioxygenase [Nocardioides sp. zg-536]|uniref:2,3-dihydroxyphenylpropionate/2,3-dihydroxicinnamic acid 1,2-dioxygenase n=1 Tax=Nocardioides faecalis TaxID=2803858 RepID=A0A938Y3N3_9ACTN|nr:3-carboxyethylcatechol 2,3-dioxygenase [Nocardioides faecalis]MBM9458645.1 3-carboxyethylcatechol 2,3-dioxygenase [Nocardioides faecalis]QVI58640.1 3-carboxyethylcatechol 2,3-dioxygenase [Nocardioides faecalis]